MYVAAFLSKRPCLLRNSVENIAHCQFFVIGPKNTTLQPTLQFERVQQQPF